MDKFIYCVVKKNKNDTFKAYAAGYFPINLVCEQDHFNTKKEALEYIKQQGKFYYISNAVVGCKLVESEETTFIKTLFLVAQLKSKFLKLINRIKLLPIRLLTRLLK